MAPRPTDLLTLTREGLYCPPGDFHVDPVRPVPRALITHGHADHARAGHGAVLATPETLRIMAVRYGEEFCRTRQEARLGEEIRLNDVTVRFHPAGHVLGSAQIAIEQGGCRIVNSGDYKRARDPTCRPFEVVPCDVFITEATFGLPVFRHPEARDEVRRLLDSVRLFPERTHIVGAYALGKAQRVMALLREEGFSDPIYLHGAMEKLTDLYRREGIRVGETIKVVAAERPKLGGRIVLCPPSAIQDLWSRKFPDPVTAFASGWMQVRARARQKGVELPLIVSDHSDWDDLCRTIKDTGAGEVWVTHGQEDALVHWCETQGIRAKPLHMLGYGDEGEAEPEGKVEENKSEEKRSEQGKADDTKPEDAELRDAEPEAGKPGTAKPARGRARKTTAKESAA
ncbi:MULTISPECIES: ligase-associated DNA damage response exonuclease [Methylobacterium]|uniref:ligase-associated DNA damage response exonuclease n=1 Tax=Methylobacterium TaxID=407 RepID=UPI00272DCA8E|nr:ligase-associated DNA damage response exonuclease [Methylobacterium sp.]